MKKIITSLLLFSCLAGSLAQETAMEKAWDLSQTQWLCQQLELEQPNAFSGPCPEINNLPTTSDASADEYAAFVQMLSADCSRLKKLKSLSDLYFPLFNKKIESIGLSSDYKFIPLILSGLNPSYIGRNDRSGLWQLDFITARKFGVEINAEVDFRNAPDLSTDVAMAYLNMLEGKYHGNRNKVLLAYFKSIAYVQKQPDVLDIDLLDSESRDFLIAMQILPVLWEKLNVENSLFAYIELLNGYENLVFEKEVSYYSLSKVLGIKESDMRQGNPVFIGGHIPAMYRDQPFILKKKYFDQYNLLKDSIFSFEEKEKTRLLAQAQKQKKELASNIPPGATEHIYKVRSGDVLGLIAQKYGVKVSDLRNWNNLRGDRINAGQSLVVYRKKGSSLPVEKTEKQIPPETKLDSSPQPGTSYINYDVKPGESLWLIARKFPGVSAENIMNWNDIDEDIKPGQTLKIYR